jgi:hypothetical protein
MGRVQGSAPGQTVERGKGPASPKMGDKTGDASAASADTPDDGTYEVASVDEQLGIELARLRARSAVDPAIATRTLAPAWNGSAAGVEDDEAEFLDAMADCLGAGLSLRNALDCWHAGDLAYQPDEDAAADDEASFEAAVPEPPHHVAGRRLLIR